MTERSPYEPPEADLEVPKSTAPAPSPWHPLVRVGLYLGLFMAVQLVIAFPALVLWAALTGANPIRLLQGEGVAAFTLFAYVCMAPVLVPLTLAYLRRVDGKSLAGLGWRAPEDGGRGWVLQGLAAVGAAGGLLGAWLVAVAWLGEVSFGGLWEGFARAGGGTPGRFGGVSGGFLLLALQAGAWIVQAGVEEWVFRGYVFRTLRERWSWVSAAGASSLVFAFFHTVNQGIDAAALANTLLLGMLLAAALELTGSLWAASLFHGAWNFLMAGILSLPVSGVGIFHLLELSVDGPRWLTGGDYGPEASWLLTGLLVPVVALLALRVDRRTAEEEESSQTSPSSE
jgi:membrane protease YdiL (CAAX protease family)